MHHQPFKFNFKNLHIPKLYFQGSAMFLQTVRYTRTVQECTATDLTVCTENCSRKQSGVPSVSPPKHHMHWNELSSFGHLWPHLSAHLYIWARGQVHKPSPTHFLTLSLSFPLSSSSHSLILHYQEQEKEDWGRGVARLWPCWPRGDPQGACWRLKGKESPLSSKKEGRRFQGGGDFKWRKQGGEGARAEHHLHHKELVLDLPHLLAKPDLVLDHLETMEIKN